MSKLKITAAEARQPSGIIVKKIIISEDDKNQVLKHYFKNNPTYADKECSVSTGGDYGYVETDKGMFVLETEGVGSTIPISDTNPLLIEWYISPKGRMALMPQLASKYTATDIKDDFLFQEVPLEKFIRSFGHRLEGNYYEWVKFFQTKTKPIVSDLPKMNTQDRKTLKDMGIQGKVRL